MRKLRSEISYALGNECGGPNVEQIMGIAVALAVGAGMFLLGRQMYDWFNGSVGGSISNAYSGNDGKDFAGFGA